jgi:hypothetical protein
MQDPTRAFPTPNNRQQAKRFLELDSYATKRHISSDCFILNISKDAN